jgi:hypothetical protein
LQAVRPGTYVPGRTLYRFNTQTKEKYEETKEFLKQIPEDAEDYAKAEKLLDELD